MRYRRSVGGTDKKRYEKKGEKESRLDVDEMLGIVERLTLPASIKKNLEEPILTGAFVIKC